MNVAVRTPHMTRERFFEWAQAQDARYEFDGSGPVTMTGGTINHSLIVQNIYAALRPRLKGGACRVLGPDAGLATVGDKVRYPDALVTCTRSEGTAHLVPGVLTVFEVLSPGSGRTDRVVKLREYRAVPSIRGYVLLEHAGIGLTHFARAGADQDWTATPLLAEDTLRLPEIGAEVPVPEFYLDVEFAPDRQ